MSNFLKTAMMAAVIGATSLTPVAFAGQGLSEALLGSTMVAGSLIAIPFVLSIKGSEATGTTFANMSKAIQAEEKWTIKSVEQTEQGTKLTLKSQDKTMQLTVTVPTAAATKAGVEPRNFITTKRLGDHSISLNYRGSPLGVLADESAGLSHSQKRE